MKEYIDRELLLKEIKEYRENDPWWAIRGWWDAYRRRRYFTLFGLVVSKFPAADVVEVRHAKWVSSEQYNGRPECPVCFYVTDEKTNYCPHCGAKMDKEE